MPIDKHIINANLEAEGVINAQLDKSGYTEDETSVMAGKAAIAASITNKGVPADKTDSFHQLSEKVSRITGEGGTTALSELTDVEISAPTAGQILVFDDTEDTWINGDAENSSEQIISMADYLALTDAERNNGTSYYIYDAVNEGREIQPVIYSLEEREIGVWTDGKPLYQKTFIENISGSGDSQEQHIDITALNIDSAVSTEGIFNRINDGNSFYSWYPFNVYENSNIFGWARFTTSDNNITYHIHLENNNERTDTQIITIRYTKTTDTPGSGIWTPSGVPAVHYDSNEKIIGTWFGETLYEKTIYCGDGGENTFVTIPHNISNIGRFVKVFGCSEDGEPLPTVNGGTDFVRLNATFQNIEIKYQDRWSGHTSIYITLQYTKSS